MKKYVIGADIIRIVSGFGVVLIHVTDPFITYPPFLGIGGFSWLLLNIINAAFRFSVPLFIMLSGYLLLDLTRKMDTKTFYKKRFWRIGIPFIFWTIFYFYWQHLLGSPVSIQTILIDLFTVNIEHLYFLFIITQLYALTPLISLVFRQKSHVSQSFLFTFSIILTLIIGAANYIFTNATLFTRNIITIFLPYTSYYIAGYFLQNIHSIAKNAFYSFLAYVTLVLFTAFASNGILSSYYRSYASPNIILMTFIVFIVLLNISPAVKILRHNITAKIIKHIASTIFGIYLVHVAIINIASLYLNFAPEKMHAISLPIIAMGVIGVFVASYLITIIGKQIPFVKMIFG